jgi:hypothetical protein
MHFPRNLVVHSRIVAGLLGTGKVHTGFWWGNWRERGRMEDLGLDGRIILNWVFKKLVGGHGLH